jgi:predicted acyl esterase
MMSEKSATKTSRLSFGTVLRDVINPAALAYPGHGYQESREDGMFIQRDVAVTMRDGVKMFVDLYRPEGVNEKLPVLLAWSPYGKHGGVKLEFLPGHDVDPKNVSKHYRFEAVDPLYWCQHGYAVAIADPRNTWASEGDGEWGFFTTSEAEDYYDLVEWAGVQDWSNGKVGLIGQSYFTIIQWRVAALNPPHLACIAPWGGASDLMRDLCYHGGIPNDSFIRVMNMLSGFAFKGKAEDWLASPLAHPFDDAYWADKRADLSRITVPAYVVADWSDILVHTPGTMDGYSKISSKQKWLEINGRKKWERFVQPEHVARLRAFYDKFLKGAQTEVDTWPPVRIEVREQYKVGRMYDEQEWPLARTSYQKLHLQTGNKVGLQPQAAETSQSYDAVAGELVFDYPIEKKLELTGFMKLRLWVEADGADDMDLFVAVRKIDREGKVVNFPFCTVFNNGEAALGFLRVSHRAPCPERSTEFRPVLAHTGEVRLSKGEIVMVDIPLLPSSTLFEPGDTLRLMVRGRDIVESDPQTPMSPGHTMLRNQGRHIVHFGGKYDSHLLVPVIPDRG